MKHWGEEARQIWLKKPGELNPVSGAEPALISETCSSVRCVVGWSGGVGNTGRFTKVSPFGIFCDYGNEFGMAAISSDVWVEWTGANRPINAGLFLDNVSKVQETRDRLRIAYPGLDIRNEKELRNVALGIFEQTFQATNALSLIGLAVAFAGLLLGYFRSLMNPPKLG